MAMKGEYTFPRSSELELRHKMQFNTLPGISFLRAENVISEVLNPMTGLSNQLQIIRLVSNISYEMLIIYEELYCLK